MDFDNEHKPEVKRQPAFNAPTIILVGVAAFVIVHVLQKYVLSEVQAFHTLLRFAFIPLRYDYARLEAENFAFPGGFAGDIWTFVTYSFMHGDWLHLFINAFWMLAFGSALARRFGTLRFLILSALGSVGGALLHLGVNWGEPVPMVGASAAISAHMGAMVRFAFVPYGPLGSPRSNHPGAYFLPSLSIRGVFKNSKALTFLVIWFAINLIFGVGSSDVAGEGGTTIAWQAHIGGFLVGFLLFPVFDPAKDLTKV